MAYESQELFISVQRSLPDITTDQQVTENCSMYAAIDRNERGDTARIDGDPFVSVVKTWPCVDTGQQLIPFDSEVTIRTAQCTYVSNKTH